MKDPEDLQPHSPVKFISGTYRGKSGVVTKLTPKQAYVKSPDIGGKEDTNTRRDGRQSFIVVNKQSYLNELLHFQYLRGPRTPGFGACKLLPTIEVTMWSCPAYFLHVETPEGERTRMITSHTVFLNYGGNVRIPPDFHETRAEWGVGDITFQPRSASVETANLAAPKRFMEQPGVEADMDMVNIAECRKTRERQDMQAGLWNGIRMYWRREIAKIYGHHGTPRNVTGNAMVIGRVMTPTSSQVVGAIRMTFQML
eukprot:gene21507-25866_t